MYHHVTDPGDGSNGPEGSRDLSLTRRSLLALTGAALTSTAGCAGDAQLSTDEQVANRVTFGYGGAPVLEDTTSSRVDASTTSATAVSALETQRPYGGDAWSLPGTIQAENFDLGGETVSYHDTTTKNKDRSYRPQEGVDIDQVDTATNRHAVTRIEDGEWLEYTLVVSEGVYDIRARVSSPRGGGRLKLAFDGSTKAIVTVPKTRGWTKWQTVELDGVELAGGSGRILRLTAEGGRFHLDEVEFVRRGSIPTTQTATVTSTKTATATTETATTSSV